MWRIVRMAVLLAAASSLGSGSVCGQSQTQPQTHPPPKQDPDRPGTTCAKVLQMTSSEWIANITDIHDSSVDGQLRGIRIYGDCYDARTKRLAAALGKAGNGPVAGAREDFKDFDAALKDFTDKALVAVDPPADAVKSAYASLYEKQFRYAFYQGYEPKSARAPGSPNQTATHASAPATAPKSSAAPDASSKMAPSEADDMTKAKNRFGELLDMLPEDKLHVLHASFGKILGLHPTSADTQLAVYRYAIFVLDPSPAPNSLDSKQPAKPFSSPPF